MPELPKRHTSKVCPDVSRPQLRNAPSRALIIL
jgi:hypothetical protein